MFMRGPSVGAVLFGVFVIPLVLASPVRAQSNGAELGTIYIWIGAAIGLALLVALGIEAWHSRARTRRLALVWGVGLHEFVLRKGISGQLVSLGFELTNKKSGQEPPPA